LFSKAKDGDLDLEENGDVKESTSIDGETGSVDHNKEECEDGSIAESSVDAFIWAKAIVTALCMGRYGPN
jgi:hypothetical protein